MCSSAPSAKQPVTQTKRVKVTTSSDDVIEEKVEKINLTGVGGASGDVIKLSFQSHLPQQESEDKFLPPIAK